MLYQCLQFDNFIDSDDGSDDEACTYQPSTRNHSNGTDDTNSVDDTHSTNDTKKATTSDVSIKKTMIVHSHNIECFVIPKKNEVC